MKSLLLGGYGQFGLATAKQLARYDLIDEIIIAGRNLEKAQQAAAEIGQKGGRPARAAFWVPQPYYTEGNWLDMTAAPVAVSVIRLLRGEIGAPGVHPNLDEVDSLDEAQLAEVQSLLPEVPAGVPFLDRRIEFLDRIM
jgi:NAD(P)-dependent dehydrogenase (short-subunit alcohol dehydrogenase family)